ncbi:unnamed protein product, partial [Ectocarpus sp. 13 AM-2016]
QKLYAVRTDSLLYTTEQQQRELGGVQQELRRSGRAADDVDKLHTRHGCRTQHVIATFNVQITKTNKRGDGVAHLSSNERQDPEFCQDGAGEE